jgi:periplasmic divalent cation tolerance protein
MSGGLVVLSAVGSEEDAERIAQALVQRRLAACVNVVPGIKSFYWWEGKIARDGEWLLVMKTSASAFDRLRDALVELHPYDLPEVVALAVDQGYGPYLEWIDGSVGAS